MEILITENQFKNLSIYLNEDITNTSIWFHGSPHLFNKFDSIKIGTGEGGILFGWGFYFTKNRNKAIAYANSLKNMKFKASQKIIDGEYNIKYKNKKLSDTKIGYNFIHLIKKFSKEVSDKKYSLKESIENYIRELENEIDYINKKGNNSYLYLKRKEEISNEKIFCNYLLSKIDDLVVIKPKVIYIDEIVPDVYLYEVNIMNIETFLIQRKLLNEITKYKISKMCNAEMIDINALSINDNDGGLVYGYLADIVGPKKASLLFSKYGIGGMLYSDDCVVFDDNLINIKNVYVVSKY